MIAGKTHSEIVLMGNWSRRDWYKKISLEEKKEAKRMMEVVRCAKLSASWTMERKAKMGAIMKNKILTEEHKAKISASNIGKILSEEHKVKIRVANMGHIVSEETKTKISAANMGIARSEEAKAKRSGKNHWNFNNWISRAPYCHKWNEPLRERYRNYWGRVCVLSDMLRSVMGSNSGLDDFEGHEIFSKRRLSVHHIRGDKMAGCNGKEMALIPLQGGLNSKRFNGLRLEEHPFYITLFLLKDMERKHHEEMFNNTSL